MYTFIVKVLLLILLVHILCETIYTYVQKNIHRSKYLSYSNPCVHSLNLKKLKAQKLRRSDEISVTLQLYLSIIYVVTCTKCTLFTTFSSSLFSKFSTVHGLYGGNAGLAVPVEVKKLLAT